MLHFSVPGKAYLSVCPVTLLAFSKLEARALIEELLKEYNQVRPHSALRYRPPAPEAIMPVIMPMGLT
ncbi:MAG: transposase [Dehalococcoidia bacterium]|nr:transposase [Dehalococcoidia bacterium]